jgi:D-tyrosyl-tRNA(Tyr) deacylase
LRAVVQRVIEASVRVGPETAGRIGRGLVVLVGVARDDAPEDARRLAEKIAHLRLFPQGDKEFHLSPLEAGAEILAVSQFTLLADTSKGRRPSFDGAAPAEQARPLFEEFLQALSSWGLKVETGRFREHMVVEIHNDGPVTLPLSTRE